MNRKYTTALALVAMISLAGCLSFVGSNSDPVVRSQEPVEMDGTSPQPPKFAHHQSDSDVETPPPLENKTPREDINVTLSEIILIDKINDYRADSGSGRLVSDPRLARIARHHSYDMATRDFFNHTNPDGETFADRVQESSYACGGGGENLRGVFWNRSYSQTEEELAEVILRGFIESPEHNTGMLLPSHDTIGVGIYIAEDGRTYATVNFCDANPGEENEP
ncbi:CAP domain-containing protein [Halobaculum rubrum]|uniref:CAP domain-containing protein n=1 Tax=Halobaculum rubrum TaxID=2872158 RepID=UPI001CA43579|nr:CAP domain-containing protein [Halobaculum rubrum]QZX99049.1 CAP domain-containing protein [Halobaculum rubrum]